MKFSVSKVSLAEYGSSDHIACSSAHMRPTLNCQPPPRWAAQICATKAFGSACPGLHSPSILTSAPRFILSDVVSIRRDA